MLWRMAVRDWIQNIFQPRTADFGPDVNGTPGQASVVTNSPTLHAAAQVRAELLSDLTYEVDGAPVLAAFIDSMSMRRFLYEVEYEIYMRGAVYGVVIGQGRAPRRMRLYNKTDVQPQVSSDGTVTSYQVLRLGSVLPERVLEFKQYDGQGAVDRLKDVIALEVQSLESRAAYLKDGVDPRVIIRYDGPGTMDRDKIVKNREALLQYFDKNKTGRAIIFPKGLMIETVDAPADPSFEQSLEAARLEVSTDSRVPLQLLAFKDAVTYNNIESLQRYMYDTIIHSEADLIAEVINDRLGSLMRSPTPDAFRFRFDDVQPLSAWRQADAASVNQYASGVAKLVQAGIYSADDPNIRRYLDTILDMGDD